MDRRLEARGQRWQLRRRESLAFRDQTGGIPGQIEFPIGVVLHIAERAERDHRTRQLNWSIRLGKDRQTIAMRPNLIRQGCRGGIHRDLSFPERIYHEVEITFDRWLSA